MSAISLSSTVASQRKAFRPDIEGLRAVAIGLVLVFHAGVRFVPGGFVGVDVFFVISGFLITGLLVREVQRDGRVSLARFYARRAKRLLPAAGLVLAVTSVLTWLTVSVVEWKTFGWDIIGSALYVVNWVLAGRSVDYLAEDVGVSPVQHFWSLAVEEQFYIVWPLLIVFLAWWLRRHAAARTRVVLGIGIFFLIVPSFVWSLYLTDANPERAFFVTTTRLWEMGIGSFVAIGVPLWKKFSPKFSTIFGWLGLGAVVLSGFVITAETAWPGYAALLPTLGTAAVIIAGFTATKYGPGLLLSWRPAVWVGGLSYSLYLWHWPLLVAATAYWGELGAKKGLLITALAFIPAYVGHKLVENPFRFAPPIAKSNRLALSLGANFSLIGVIAGLGLIVAVPNTNGTGPSGDGGSQSEALGAAIFNEKGEDFDPVEDLQNIDWFVPSAVDATADVPPAYSNGCHADQLEANPIRCEWGDTTGAVKIVVVGDSKIEQWEPALDTIAKKHGWHMFAFTKSACAFGTAVQSNKGNPYTSCADWNKNVLNEIDEIAPDVVITSSRAREALISPGESTETSGDVMVNGMIDAREIITDAGIGLITIMDNPSPGENIYECVADNFPNLAACTFMRSDGEKASGKRVLTLASEAVDGTMIDLNKYVCPTEVCAPVVGNVLVYRQASHLTDTYIRSLRPALERELVPAVKKIRQAGQADDV